MPIRHRRRALLARRLAPAITNDCFLRRRAAFGGPAILVFLVFVALASGCRTSVHFSPHGATGRHTAAPVALGLYFTTGTLLRVEPYKDTKVSWFRTFRVQVGEALEREAFSRLRPRVQTLTLHPSPHPDDSLDSVLTLGIREFGWINLRGETLIQAQLRGPDGALLVDKTYVGVGSAQLHRIRAKQVVAPQGLGETTREAMASALLKIIDDIEPYLVRHPPPDDAR